MHPELSRNEDAKLASRVVLFFQQSFYPRLTHSNSGVRATLVSAPSNPLADTDADAYADATRFLPYVNPNQSSERINPAVAQRRFVQRGFLSLYVSRAFLARPKPPASCLLSSWSDPRTLVRPSNGPRLRSSALLAAEKGKWKGSSENVEQDMASNRHRCFSRSSTEPRSPHQEHANALDNAACGVLQYGMCTSNGAGSRLDQRIVSREVLLPKCPTNMPGSS